MSSKRITFVLSTFMLGGTTMKRMKWKRYFLGQKSFGRWLHILCLSPGSQISKSVQNSLLLERNWCREICLHFSSLLNISKSSQEMCLCPCFPARQEILLGWKCCGLAMTGAALQSRQVSVSEQNRARQPKEPAHWASTWSF